MSSISAIGRELFQYIPRGTGGPVHEADQAQPVVGGDAEGGGNAGSGGYRGDEISSFGRALLMTLEEYGIDPRQFQRDFLAALSKLGSDDSGGGSSSSLGHINTLG